MGSKTAFANLMSAVIQLGVKHEISSKSVTRFTATFGIKLHRKAPSLEA
jgi:hypothetical protein